MDGRPFAGWISKVRHSDGGREVTPIFVSRDGARLLVREPDPCDPPPDPIPTFEGDEIHVATPVAYTSVNTNSEVGDLVGLVLALPLAETRREPGHVYARTLRHGEPYNGRRIHLAPGDSLTIESLTVALEYIDDQQEATKSGHKPITPVMRTWLSMGKRNETVSRYMLALARRLDTANSLLIEIDERRDAIENESPYGPALRVHIFELIGLVESAVLALSRAVDMVVRTETLLGKRVPVPSVITGSSTALTEIRNAYEHIEDRALGQVRQKPDANALSIFDYTSLIRDHIIEYGTHQLDLTT